MNKNNGTDHVESKEDKQKPSNNITRLSCSRTKRMQKTSHENNSIRESGEKREKEAEKQSWRHRNRGKYSRKDDEAELMFMRVKLSQIQRHSS